MDPGDPNSDDESYTTLPESNQNDEIVTDDKIEDDEIDPIDPNTAEITDDEDEQEISEDNDSELEELLNNPSNDTTIDIGNLLNLPDILDIQGTSTETQTPEAQTPGNTQTRPDSPWRPRYPCRPHSPWKTYPLVKDTILHPIHQETPSPNSIGCCVPRSK